MRRGSGATRTKASIRMDERMTFEGGGGIDIEQQPAAPLFPVKGERDNLPWVEKYRPSSLDELIDHEEIITILEKLINSNKLPHLLFHGPPGTGKTSTIIACAKKM